MSDRVEAKMAECLGRSSFIEMAQLVKRTYIYSKVDCVQMTTVHSNVRSPV